MGDGLGDTESPGCGKRSLHLLGNLQGIVACFVRVAIAACVCGGQRGGVFLCVNTNMCGVK